MIIVQMKEKVKLIKTMRLEMGKKKNIGEEG
jgi:hypothetical protein